MSPDLALVLFGALALPSAMICGLMINFVLVSFLPVDRARGWTLALIGFGCSGMALVFAMISGFAAATAAVAGALGLFLLNRFLGKKETIHG